MKNLLIFIPLTVIYLSFKTALFPGLPLPDITLVIVFFISSERATVGGAVLAFILGYIDDIFSGGIIGSSSSSLIIAFAAVHVFTRWIEFSEVAIKVAAVFSLSVMKSAVVYLILRSHSIDAGFLSMALPLSITTAIFAPVIISLFKRISAMKLWRMGLV